MVRLRAGWTLRLQDLDDMVSWKCRRQEFEADLSFSWVKNMEFESDQSQKIECATLQNHSSSSYHASAIQSYGTTPFHIHGPQ